MCCRAAATFAYLSLCLWQDRLFGRLDVMDPVSRKALPPVVLPLWECHPPLTAGLIRAATHLLAFMIVLAESEQPAAQFGEWYDCGELTRLAVASADDFIAIADALHPPFQTAKKRWADWLVLSPYLFLIHIMKRRFGAMCDGPITIGMMSEDCFETCHVLSKGAISGSTAPQKYADYNKLSLALRRRSREEQVLKGQPGSHIKREDAQFERWGQQITSRVASLERAVASSEYLSWCAAGGGTGPETWTGYLADYHQPAYVSGTDAASFACPGAPLLEAGSRASPINTLDGAAEADAEGEQDEEREGEGEQPDLASQQVHTDPSEERETADEEAAQHEHAPRPTDVCTTLQSGLSGEENEYEMSDEAALEAMGDQAVERPDAQLANIDRDDDEPPANKDGDGGSCAADSPEAVMHAACADGERLPASSRLDAQSKGALKKLAGRQGVRLKGLTAIAKKPGKEPLVTALVAMAGAGAEIEIGAWTDWARQRIASFGPAV